MELPEGLASPLAIPDGVIVLGGMAMVKPLEGVASFMPVVELDLEMGIGCGCGWW